MAHRKKKMTSKNQYLGQFQFSNSFHPSCHHFLYDLTLVDQKAIPVFQCIRNTTGEEAKLVWPYIGVTR